MGVLYDYFRAPDPQVAARAMDRPGGPLIVGDSGEPTFDGVDMKGIDPSVALGQLLAFIRDVPWSVDLVQTEPVSPPAKTEPRNLEEFRNLPEDSPWASGPWLEGLGTEVRDNLATVDEARLPELATRWADIEEFYGHMDPSDAVELIREFVALARRARDAGDGLFCWSSL